MKVYRRKGLENEKKMNYGKVGYCLCSSSYLNDVVIRRWYNIIKNLVECKSDNVCIKVVDSRPESVRNMSMKRSSQNLNLLQFEYWTDALTKAIRSPWKYVEWNANDIIYKHQIKV